MKKLIHDLFLKEKSQTGKKMNVLVNYVKHIYSILALCKCAFLIAPCMHVIHKNRFSLCLYFIFSTSVEQSFT